ncbi:hypothetical protein KKC59_01405 [bacterium]|nr:hypothetical protein [bacterium]
MNEVRRTRDEGRGTKNHKVNKRFFVLRPSSFVLRKRRMVIHYDTSNMG